MQNKTVCREEEEEYFGMLCRGEARGEKKAQVCRKSEANFSFGNANETRILAAERMLHSYRTIECLLEIGRRETDRGEFSGDGARKDNAEHEMQMRMRMYEIRRMILSLDDDEAKLFLYYRYIYGESILRCAEMLSISRATAYRVRRRALGLVADLMSDHRLEA